jgi:hypothetical protein
MPDIKRMQKKLMKFSRRQWINGDKVQTPVGTQKLSPKHQNSQKLQLLWEYAQEY